MGLWSKLLVARQLGRISRLYAERLAEFGPNHRGVIWNHADEHRLRFEVLLQVVDAASDTATVNDLGCGYGALFDLLVDEPFFRGGRYFGYDVCADMVDAARRLVSDPRASFEQSAMVRAEADYSFASGTFNLKLDADEEPWSGYVRDSLRHLWSHSRRGLAFNMLDARGSVPGPLFYYAYPDVWLDFCRSDLGAEAELVDGYGLKEWTILARR